MTDSNTEIGAQARKTLLGAGLFCLSIGLLSWATSSFGQTVSDSTFANANWNLNQFVSGSGGSVTAAQVSSGGNPGAFRNVTDSLTGGGTVSIVLGTSIFTPFTYSPTVSGPIASLNYSEDAACVSGCFGSGQSTGPALLQAGNLYILSTSTVITGPATTWSNHALSGLTALDFGLVNVTTTTLFDNTQHPNFSSSAAPIQFGFFRANGTGAGGVGYTLAAGIDNWQVTVIAGVVPPPVTVPVVTPTLGAAEIALLALMVGLLGVAWSRRRS